MTAHALPKRTITVASYWWASPPLFEVTRYFGEERSTGMQMRGAFRSHSGTRGTPDNSKSWYSTSWGNHTSELRVVTCHMDDTVLPATDTSECVPSNPSHAGWYLTYLSWRDGRLSCSSWLDSETAGRRTSDLLITSLMLNHCTTKAANSKHSNMLTWWIMSTAGCKDGKEPPPARQSVVYCRHCVLDRFWWLYYVAVLASSSLLQTLTLMSSYSAHLGCFCDHHWRHSCCDWSSCFQRRFLY